MFQKQLSLFFALLMFMACSNAKPVPEIVNSEEKKELETENNLTGEIKNAVADKDVPEEKAEIKSQPEPKQVKKEVVTGIKVEKKPVEAIKDNTTTVDVPANEVVIETPIVEEERVIKELDPITHDKWNALLQKYVSADGKVNYSGFKSDKEALQVYLDELAANPIQKSWSRNEKMAYWINAYNAFTVKMIVDNYPISSIMKINGGKAWEKKWIKLGDKTYSLNQIENDILRPQYKDARIHFAVNCAAKSCPPLLNKAWTAGNLEKNFEQQARNFINNSNYNVISEKKVQLSNIFEWYAGDFGDIISYLNKYATVKIKPNAKISYLKYNWDLNK
jgi:hypothetical protein